MRDPEIPEYLGKAALPGVGKQLSQDRTRILTSQAPIVQKANRGELFALFDGMGSKGQGGADAAELMCDIHKLPLAQCEFLVLVSDGVTDRCSPEDIADIVSGQQETSQAAMGLVRLAKARKAHDDLTAIVLDAGEVLGNCNRITMPGASDEKAAHRHIQFFGNCYRGLLLCG